MSLSKIERRVRKLRDLIDKKGLGVAVDKFEEILGDIDSSAIRPLLFMRPYPDMSRLDEMYTIIHAVEGFPAEDYLHELAKAAGDLSLSSPYLLETLLIRVANADSSTPGLIREFQAAPHLAKETRSAPPAHS